MLNEDVKVSIVTVCYNSEKTIKNTIDSILNQTYKNIEYIIVDGESTDSTLKIIEEYKNQFSEDLKIICEKDKGIYDAMNKGIKIANGEIIGILNSDDFYDKGTIECIVKRYIELKKPKKVIIAGEVVLFNEKYEKILGISKERFLNKIKTLENPIRHPATFVTKNVYDEIGVFDLKYRILADNEFVLRAYFSGIKFDFLNKSFTYMSDGGISNSFKGNIIKIIDRYILLKNYSKGLKKYGLFFSYSLKSLIKNFLPKSLLDYYRENDN
jgi:glycosyltransferase involved in cell wall biosynthesis